VKCLYILPEIRTTKERKTRATFDLSIKRCIVFRIRDTPGSILGSDTGCFDGSSS
jgi:hypothetical protein